MLITSADRTALPAGREAPSARASMGAKPGSGDAAALLLSLRALSFEAAAAERSRGVAGFKEELSSSAGRCCAVVVENGWVAAGSGVGTLELGWVMRNRPRPRRVEQNVLRCIAASHVGGDVKVVGALYCWFLSRFLDGPGAVTPK